MDFEALKQYRSTRSPFTRRLGITVDEVRTGYAVASMAVTAEDINSYDTVHGGVCYTLADIACGAACASYGKKSMTTDAAFHYLGSGRQGDTLTAEAVVRKQGKHLGLYDVSVVNQEGKLLATGSFTYYMMDQELSLETES